MKDANAASNYSALLSFPLAVLLSLATKGSISRSPVIAVAALMTAYACLCAGDAVAAGQRHREALAAQLDPHTGESARLAVMAQEAEAALSALEVGASLLFFCTSGCLASRQVLKLCKLCKLPRIPYYPSACRLMVITLSGTPCTA